MAFVSLTLLNGLSYGLLLFMLSAGLTLIFSMMGVLNFAHASFYMLGAYVAYSLTPVLGFWLALVLAPVLVGGLGALAERCLLRPAHQAGHVAQLLLTFGLAYVVLELVQLIWGRSPLSYALPPALQGPLWTLYGAQFPRYRVFVMVLALLVLLGLGWILRRTRLGLLLQAALSQPRMLQALGHNVPALFTLVFGAGCALAALAGVLAGHSLVIEPGMAASVGAMVFVVVVVGGLGSLAGAFWASLLMGLVQTVAATSPAWSTWAPLLPFVLMVLVLVARPRGLMGLRGD